MKPLGRCPWCGEEIRAIVVGKNYIRRDNCKCPKCGKKILICHFPGCNNYTKGGIWDDEFCPDCTKHVVRGGIGLALSLFIGQKVN